MIKEENINCTVEALVLASPEPVSVRQLCDVIEEVSPARIRQAVDDLNNIYLGCGSSFRIREVAGGYQFHILPDFERAVKKMLVKERAVRLSRAALETLAIIAYKQPVTKIDIEHIRGVSTDGVIHNLLQRNLIVISGRAETPGRPLLYKTSNEFLKFFGLNRLSDLPRMDEIEEMIRMAEGPKEQTMLPFDGEGAVAMMAAWSDEEDGKETDRADMEKTMAKVLFVQPLGMIAEEDLETIEDISEDGGNGSRMTGKLTLVESVEPVAEEQLSESEVTTKDDWPNSPDGLPDMSSILSIYEPLSDEPPSIYSGDNGHGRNEANENDEVFAGSGESSESDTFRDDD